MLKKTFIRVTVLGIIAFASFFVISAAKTAEDVSKPECIESSTESVTVHPQGEFILEALVRSIPF